MARDSLAHFKEGELEAELALNFYRQVTKNEEPTILTQVSDSLSLAELTQLCSRGSVLRRRMSKEERTAVIDVFQPVKRRD